MQCTPAYVKKNNSFTGSQFSYSDCCMHVSHKNENYRERERGREREREREREKTARKETFCNGLLISTSDYGRIALFPKKMVCFENST